MSEIDRESVQRARAWLEEQKYWHGTSKDEVRAFLACHDAMAEAHQRICHLTPQRANAATARDLHLTVKAIADTALEAYAPPTSTPES